LGKGKHYLCRLEFIDWKAYSWHKIIGALLLLQSVNADELCLSENENLEIIGPGDGDGWLLVCIDTLMLIRRVD